MGCWERRPNAKLLALLLLSGEEEDRREEDGLVVVFGFVISLPSPEGLEEEGTDWRSMRAHVR